MEIRLSKYNAPFSEPSDGSVHWISLDDQRDMRIGNYSAHVRLYRSASHPQIIEFDDPLTGRSHIVDLSESVYFPPFVRNPVLQLDSDDLDLMNDLYYNSGIRAAGKRIGREC